MKNNRQNKNQPYCVIGVGKFGRASVLKFREMKCPVMALDKNMEQLERLSAYDIDVHQVDSTNKEALIAIGVQRCNTVIIGISDDIEASILTASVLSELEISNIYARAIDERHSKILKKMGTHVIFRPEQEAGVNASIRAAYQIPINYESIAKDLIVFSVCLTNVDLFDIKLHESELKQKYSANIIAIRRGRTRKVFMPEPDTTFLENDVITILSKRQDALNIINFIDPHKDTNANEVNEETSYIKT